MSKLDTITYAEYNHTLNLYVENTRFLYQTLKLCDIMVYTDIQEQINMNKKAIINTHKKMYNFWQNANTGKWYSYLPKEGVKPPKGKQIESVSEENLINKIFDYYTKEEEKKQNTSPTFSAVYWKWRAIKDLELGGNSIIGYNTNWKRFFEYSDFAEMPIDTINENTIRFFMLSRIKELDLRKDTCRKLFDSIKHVIRYARVEKLILENPVEFLENRDFTKLCNDKIKPENECYFNDTELSIIINALNEYHKEHPLNMASYAIHLAVFTGMRTGELCTLKWSDIENGCISINKSCKYNSLTHEFSVGNTKTKKSRKYPLDDQIKSLFKRIKQIQIQNGILCEWIFTDGKGSYIHTHGITDLMNKLCKANNLNGGGITKLRKTTSSNLQSAGVPKTVVASMLGHTTDVNELYYTYDTSNLDEKQKVVQNRNAKLQRMAIG